MNKNPNKMARKGEIVLTMRGIGQAEGKLDPFAVGDTVSGAIGYAAKASVDGAGTYTIRVRSEEQAQKLIRTKKLSDGTKIRVERHATLNSVKCIIQNKLITEMTDSNLALKLKNQGVIKVRSIGPENRLKIVHLAGTSVPPFIMIGLIKVRTERYYNMPRACRKCQQIGHITDACTGEPHCGTCSGTHPERGRCNRPPHCVNCGGDHRPLDKTCPTYIQEKAIVKLQTDQDIPLKLARRKYRAKVKSRYIPLPMERTTEDTTDSESDTSEEHASTGTAEEVQDPEDGVSELEAEEEEGSGSKGPPPPPPPKNSKRKSKEKAAKSSKRKSSQRSTPESDQEDDFILDSDLDALQRRLTSEENSSE